jgi:hypothetical protein
MGRVSCNWRRSVFPRQRCGAARRCGDLLHLEVILPGSVAAASDAGVDLTDPAAIEASASKDRWRGEGRGLVPDGAPATGVVLAVGRRDRMIAYAKAARRVKEQAAQEGQSG